MVENRGGLVVKTGVNPATVTAERQAALVMDGKIDGPATLAGDGSYDTKDFVRHCRAGDIPARRMNTADRSSAIDARTTRHPGYSVSQQKRKRIALSPRARFRFHVQFPGDEPRRPNECSQALDPPPTGQPAYRRIPAAQALRPVTSHHPQRAGRAH